jgi:VWFA-related protein
MKAVALSVILAGISVPGQRPAQTPPPGEFRAAANYVSLIVTPREADGRFAAGLSAANFQILEDGIEQKIIHFGVTQGGRFYGGGTTGPAAQPVQGLIMPAARPPRDLAGRIFIVFIDDLHITPDLSPRVKEVLHQIRDTVLHDNDLVGIVSTGYSSIERDPAYDQDHRRLNEATRKVMGSGPTMTQMLTLQQGADGIAELNHHAHVAFRTAYDLLGQLEKVTNRRKAFLWISSGYSLNPLKESRLKAIQQSYAGEDPFATSAMQFKEADLLHQVAELTREANRANVTFFPIDPRGLMAGPGAEMREPVAYSDVRDFQMQTTSTLQVLASETGGVAAVNSNDLTRYLQSVDRMMSDFYVIGYQSSNSDPRRFVRKIVVNTTRAGLTLVPGIDYRDTYTIRRK